ncbi:hypothetical protein [Thalassospira profundimaris]|uniref:Uncharacterized protein n=1 Tax=Thalassospira profundimaris TaxID=502049 RepID=A0A367X5B3_9PROT|nr:hypothetical protein [Thalassospira profundimaris]RCK48858.1 hypothetical protein TH30_00530 [Thalassospira profundimaris]
MAQWSTNSFIAGAVAGIAATSISAILVAELLFGSSVSWETLLSGVFALLGGSFAFFAVQAQINETRKKQEDARREIVASRLEIAIEDLGALFEYFDSWRETMEAICIHRQLGVPVRIPPPKAPPIEFERLIDNISEFDHPHRRWLGNLVGYRAELERVRDVTLSGQVEKPEFLQPKAESYAAQCSAMSQKFRSKLFELTKYNHKEHSIFEATRKAEEFIRKNRLEAKRAKR